MRKPSNRFVIEKGLVHLSQWDLPGTCQNSKSIISFIVNKYGKIPTWDSGRGDREQEKNAFERGIHRTFLVNNETNTDNVSHCMMSKVLLSIAKVKFHCDCLLIPWFVSFQFSPICLIHVLNLDTSIYFLSQAHFLQPNYRILKILLEDSEEKAKKVRHPLCGW